MSRTFLQNQPHIINKELLYIFFVLTLIAIETIFSLPAWFVHVPLIAALLPILIEAIIKLRYKKISTEFFLVIATIVALLGHEEKAMTIVLLIMLLAEYLESFIEVRTESAITSLIQLIPTTVTIKVAKAEKEVPLQQVVAGMTVVIKTGDKIAVDGIIIQGRASVNESALTGESTIQEKTVGQSVFAGTFIESGSILVQVEKVGEQTFFGKIKKLVQQAETDKADIALLADRIALFLVPTLLIFIIGVWLVTGNIRLIVTLLVFGSPLELTVITPLTVLAGVIAAFRHGIMVKGGAALERMAYVDTIIFDKTGTLTIGEPEVVKVEVFDSSYTERDIITLAAIAEKRSGHVLAKAILKKAQQENIEVPDPDEYTSVSGHGIEIIYHGQKYFLGNKHFIEAPEHGNIKIDNRLLCSTDEELYTTFFLGGSGNLFGRICTSDILRSEAKDIINTLKSLQLKVILLSGDKKEVVKNIAQSLGIDKFYGEIFPDQKLKIIKELQNQKHYVAMIGDGINDAPALKQAFVGIAMGAMRMEPAIEAADIVLTTNNLYKIPFILKLSKNVMKVIKQNIFIGFFAIHAFGMLLAFLNIISPIQAALFHAIPDIAILINSARLIHFNSAGKALN